MSHQCQGGSKKEGIQQQMKMNNEREKWFSIANCSRNRKKEKEIRTGRSYATHYHDMVNKYFLKMHSISP